MSGLMYTSRFAIIGVTASRDLFAILVPSPDMVILHSIRIGQTNLEGDAAAQMLKIEIARVALAGSGSVNTPEPHMNGAPAASATVVTDTALAASPTFLVSDAFNLQAGWLYLPTPEERILISSDAAADTLVVRIEAPTDSPDMLGSMTFEELLG